MHDTDIQTPGSNGRPVPLGSVTHAASRGVMVRRFAERAVASRVAASDGVVVCFYLHHDEERFSSVNVRI